MTIPRWLKYYGDTIVIPLLLALLYLVFAITADLSGVADVVAAVFLVVVVGLWLAFRRLRVHASAARYAAIGEPDKLLAMADEELARRWFPVGRAPLHVYRALAYNLAGQPSEARAALTASQIKPGERATRSWQLLWASADIDARTRLGDAAGARKTFEQVVVPFRSVAPSGGIELIAAECEARVRLAEGDAAGARDLVLPAVKEMRLGPAARAQLYAIVAQCERALGDDDAAAAAAAKARSLAPTCDLVA
ncbi:MAG: hypothetical protein R3B06_13555 [Kofleriaceae bacterium]